MVRKFKLFPLVQRFSTQNTSRPVFWRGKTLRPVTEDFDKLEAFLKASFSKKFQKSYTKPATRWLRNAAFVTKR